MDQFTQKILEKADKRSKILGVSGAPRFPLADFVDHNEQQSTSSFVNTQTTAKDKNSVPLSTTASTSPSRITKYYTVDKENVDVGIEINITTKPNVEVEFEFDDRTQCSGSNENKNVSHDENRTENEKTAIKLRDCSRTRLQRLGALYSENADQLSSPIHRTENKFCEENLDADDQENMMMTNNKRRRPGLGKLDALANKIRNWEDDSQITFIERQQQSQQLNYQHHQQKQQEEISNQKYDSDDKDMSAKSDNNLTESTKQLKWDKNVIDSLEAQGFQRRQSTQKLCYDYAKDSIESSSASNKVDTTEHTVQVHDQQQNRQKIGPIKQTTPTKHTTSGTGAVSRLQTTSTGASAIQSGTVSARTAVFEEHISKSPMKQKDPSEMSLKERMMLFEKNKGKAPVPKTNLPISKTQELKTKIDSQKLETAQKSSQQTSSEAKADIKDYPIGSVNIKNKVAELLSKDKSVTISESQIKDNRSKQLQQDMNVLANRFVSRKEISSNDSTTEEQFEEQQRQQKRQSRPPNPPPPPPVPLYNTIERSRDQRSISNTNKRRSPVIVMTLDKTDQSSNINNTNDADAKRPRVSHANNGNKKRQSATVASAPTSERLYPVLSDLESDNGNCTTATMSTSSHSGFNDDNDEDEESSIKDDEIGNISLGREILNLVHSRNNTQCEATDFGNNDDQSFSSNSLSVAGVDEYLDEALDEDDDSYNERQSQSEQLTEVTDRGTTSSNSFCYQRRPKKHVHYKSISEESLDELSDDYQMQQAKHHKYKSKEHHTSKSNQLKSELTVNSDENNVVTLVHTVSFYRRQQQSNSANVTPVRKIHHTTTTDQSSRSTSSSSNALEINRNNYENDDEQNDDPSYAEREEAYLVQEKIKRLLEEICKQQQVISQASQALNLCASTIEFSGSTEAVEGERHLLVATHRRQAALDEVQRLQVEKTLRPADAPREKGRLQVKDITVPLNDEYIRKLSTDTIAGHHLVCLLKYGETVLATRTVPTLPGLTSVKFPDVLTFNKVYADFKITLQIFGMTAKKEILPHEVKYHINLNKKTPRKKGFSDNEMLIMPRLVSPGGPNAVRTPALVQYGYALFSFKEIRRDTWTLTHTFGVSPLKGIVQMKINCELSVKVTHKGFLTMFEDISGFGAWHRRWCFLNGNLLSYWKYPDDEKKKTPIGSIDLNTCCSSKVTTAPRDLCARLNTLLLECERPAREDDNESLLIIPKGNHTIVRYLLSADTKEERDEWCAYFNKTLMLLRVWNTPQQH